MGPKWGTRWTGRQSIERLTQRRTTIYTLVDLIYMSLEGGWKPEHLEESHAAMGRTGKLHIEKHLGQLDLEWIAQTTCYHKRIHDLHFKTLAKVVKDTFDHISFVTKTLMRYDAFQTKT